MTDRAEEFEDEVELASASQVSSYQRRTESGKVVTVRGYVRTDNSAVADRARQAPGRPSVSAHNGTFPGGRAIPVWPDAGKGRVPEAETSEEPVEYEGLEDTGVVDQATLDKEVPVALEIMKNLPQNPALTRLMGLLQQASTASLSDVEDPAFDPEIVELARRGIVRISGYSYISKKTGKVVRVNPYTQLRSLINALGGPSMAAKSGITADLMDRALPGFEVREKVFKAKDVVRGANQMRARRGKQSYAQAARQLADLDTVKVIDVPSPKPGDKSLSRAMSPTHALEAVRTAREGSTVVRGNDTWIRAADGLWYKTPRRNNKGVDDRSLTRSLVSKAGRVELTRGNPPTRKEYPLSKVDYDSINPNSVNYAATVRYSKAMEPVFRNLPEGVADSLNGNLDVRRPSNAANKRTNSLTHISTTKTNNFMPKLVVNPSPEAERDIMRSLPKQQREGYTVPTILHPVETAMTKETTSFAETLLNNRAPSAMTDRMYDRLSAAYDKHVKSDDGDFTGLLGKEGWLARLTGERSSGLKEEIRNGLSMSALNSPEDFLSEAFTEYVGHPNPRPLAKDMGEAFQTSLEEFNDYLFANKWVDASEIPERVYSQNIKKPASRIVSEAIDGVEDRTVDTYHGPRDLRSVLLNQSKYIDIRDAAGNPTFDAEVMREGNTARLGTLSYPLTDPDSMPTGIPEGVSFNFAEGARYYNTPMDDLREGPQNQMKYANFIDQEKALKAIEAVEETMFSEGVRRFEVDARAGEDSLLYARAGYQFDPNSTDVWEVSNMLNDLQEMLDQVKLDSQGYRSSAKTFDPDEETGQFDGRSPGGFFTIPKNEQTKITRQLNKWQREMTADPATWPTPQEIAQLGKFTETDRSLGETVLDNYAWSGVKTLNDGDFEPWVPANLDDAPYPDWFPSGEPDPDVPKPVSPTAINAVARANTASPTRPEPSQRDKDYKEAVTQLATEVLDRHRDQFPDAEVKYTGSADKHSISVKDKDGSNLFSLSVSTDEDGSVVWTGPKFDKNKLGSAFLSFDMVDHMEAAYQQSDVPYIRKNTGKNDPVGGYVMAMSGYTWNNPPSREELTTLLHGEVDAQVERMRLDLEAAASLRHVGGGTEDMFRAQGEMDRLLDGLRDSLTSQVNAYMEKFDSDPLGPTPFELAQLGKKEAYQVNQVKRAAPGGGGPSGRNPDVPRGGGGEPRRSRSGEYLMPPPLAANATPQQVRDYDREVGRIERLRQMQQRREGTLLQQMTSLDGDAIHDSFAEFIGKQALTLGAYGWYKSMGGYWKWAADSYKPSARKYTVSLLFMLLRLLPASAMRGGMMATVNQLTKKIKSSKPEDWPKPHEINEIITQLQSQIPAHKLPPTLKGL